MLEQGSGHEKIIEAEIADRERIVARSLPDDVEARIFTAPAFARACSNPG